MKRNGHRVRNEPTEIPHQWEKPAALNLNQAQVMFVYTLNQACIQLRSSLNWLEFNKASHSILVGFHQLNTAGLVK